jgi:MFS family permease
MRAARKLLSSEPRGRLFLATYAQSSLGNGAGYVALVVLAYERRHSPWAIAIVLMADFLPAMIFGPVLGAAADRWSRRWCAVAADLVRAVAFVGIAFVGGIGSTIALALLAGVGAAMFTPAALAAIPDLVEEENLPAATSLFGGITDLGRTLGPALAGVGMLVSGPEAVVLANGVTFLLSAGLLARLDFGARPQRDLSVQRTSLLREAREGLVAGARMPGIQVMLLASSGILLFAGSLNVAELLLARDLGLGSVGYSVLVAAYGAGFVAGSLTGGRARDMAELKRRYLGGILVMGLGLVLSGVAPLFGAALAAFALTGFGNGLMLVNERLIFQRAVPDRLMARLFSLADTAGSWAFAIAFVLAGALLSLVDTRTLLVIAGGGGVVIWAASAYGLRSLWTRPPIAEPASAET